MHGRQVVRPGFELVARQRLRAGRRARSVQAQRVHHDIANHVHTLTNSFLRELLSRDLGRREQPRGQMIGQDAVDLFGHAPVEASKPGLHVGHGDVQLRSRQRPGQRGVGVSVDDDGVGGLLL